MGNATETDGPTRLDPVSTQVSPAAAPQVVQAVPVPSSTPASTSAQASGSSTAATASAAVGKVSSSRLFVALIIAIIVTVAVVVAGGAFVMYRLGQSSNVPTVQVAGSASSDKSTSTAQSSEDQRSSDSSSSDSSDASDASKGSNGESGSGQSTGGQSSETSSGNASSGTSSKAQNGNGSNAQNGNAGNDASSNGSNGNAGSSNGQSTSSAASNIYVNARFRYHLTVPDGYTWNREAANGDGRTFDGPQGVRIAAWGQWNVLSHTPQGELDFLKENLDSGSSITFENVAGPSVYLSYYTPEGNIVYQKEIVTDKTLCAVEITYPPTARSIGDSLAETVPPTLGFLD